MIVKKSPKAAIDLPQAEPNHDRDFFLAISLVAQSFQRARTADDFYRAVGNAINSLGGVVTLLTVNEDGTSLTVAYTSSESKLLRKVEKLAGETVVGYSFAISSNTVHASKLASGTAEYVHWTKEDVIRMLPPAILPMISQIISIFKVDNSLLVPLRVDNETLGLMVIGGLSLSKEDMPILDAFASQIAAGMQNVCLMQKLQDELIIRNQLEESLNHNRDLLLALSHAAQSIQQVHTVDDIYQAVGDQIKSLGGDVTLLMLDEDGRSLTASYMSYASGLIRKLEKITGLPALGYRIVISPDSIYARDIASNKAEYILSAKQHFYEAFPKELRYVAEKFMNILNVEQGILAPLHVEGKTLGLMMVSGLALNEGDVPAMESFAGQIAAGLQSARLLQKLEDELTARKQAEESLNHNRNLLLALSSAAQAVQLVREPEDIYQAVGEHIKALGFEATILMFGSGHESLYFRFTTISDRVIHAAEKMAGLTAQDYSWPIAPDSIYGKIIANGKAEYIPWAGDLFAEALPAFLQPLSGKLMHILNVDHGIIAPLHVGEESYGVLIVFGSGVLSREDLPAIDSFAGQVSVSLHNALLAQQVENELKERKQAEAALRASESKIHALMDAIPDMMFMLDHEGKFLDFHSSNGQFLYISPEAFLGKNIRDVMPTELVDIYKLKSDQAVQSGESQLFEYSLDNGDEHYYEAHVVAYQGDRLLCVVRDITRRKKAEEAVRQTERHFKALIEKAPDGITLVGPDGKTRYVSPSAKKLFGYDAVDVANPVEMIHPDDLALVLGAMNDLAQNPEYIPTLEYRYKHKNGSYHWVESTFSNLLGEPSVQAVVINFRDITQRKRAETELRESESKFHGVISESADGVILSDELGRIIEFNDAIGKITGLTREEVLGKFLWDFQFQITPALLRTDEHYLRVKGGVQKVLETGQSDFLHRIMEAPFQFIDGSQRFIQQRLFSISTEKGWRLGSISRDITEQKLAAEILHKQYENLNRLYQMTAILSRTTDIDNIYRVALESLQNTISSDRASILLFEADGVMRFKAWLGLSDEYRKATEGHSPWSQSTQNPQPVLVEDVKADSNLASLLPVILEEGIGALGFIPLLHQGKLLGKFMIYFNGPHTFSDEEVQLSQTVASHVAFAIFRMQAEEALRASEERYRILYEDNPSMYFTADTEGTILSVNNFVYEQLGYSASELAGQSILNVFHPDDRDTVQQHFQSCVQQPGLAVQVEARKVRKNGTALWVRESARAVHDLNGQMVVLLICDDITERKQAQEARAASLAEMQALFASMQDAVLVINRDGVYQKVAPTNPNKFYLRPEEVIGRHLSDFFPEDKVNDFLEVIRHVLATQQTTQIEYKLEINGHSPWFESSVSPMDANTTIWVARDISERKFVETKLYLQSAALEAAANTIVITDRNGVIQWANSSFSELTGYDPSEVVGSEPGKFVKSGLQSQEFYKNLWDTILAGETWHNELINRRKDGSLYYEEMTITPLRNFDDKISHFIAVKQDITERKRAEEALIRSEKEYRALFENMPIGLYRTSADGQILDANMALVNMFGYPDRESLLSQKAGELYAEPELNNKFKNAISTKGVLSAFESEYRSYDQQTFWAEDYVHIIRDDDGHPLYYEGSLINITDRKKAENDLRQANQSLQLAHSELQKMFTHEQILARTDSLTAQINRRYFFEIATREFNASIRFQRPLTIILFDIDGFKQINDNFGHVLGDRMLIRVAQTTASQVRDVDVVARYGGDEFIILLPQTGSQQAFLIAERIREAVASVRMENENSPFIVTLSIGVAETLNSPQDETIEDVIRRADHALYQAKKHGRNHTIIYTQS